MDSIKPTITFGKRVTYSIKFLLLQQTSSAASSSLQEEEIHKMLKYCHHLLAWNCLTWLFRGITNSTHTLVCSHEEAVVVVLGVWCRVTVWVRLLQGSISFVMAILPFWQNFFSSSLQVILYFYWFFFVREVIVSNWDDPILNGFWLLWGAIWSNHL